MKYKKYSDEFKEEVVKKYLAGSGMTSLTREYDIGETQLRNWIGKWREFGAFPDGRGKSTGGGRPPRIDTTSMKKDEYIAYLEMENAILKQLRSLSNSPQK